MGNVWTGFLIAAAVLAGSVVATVVAGGGVL